jgi:tetratricopeptide (TPR) repeat protein
MKTGLLCLVLALACGCHRSPEHEAAAAIEKGKKYLESKDYPHAILEFRIALKNAPASAEAFYQAGLAYLDMLDVPAAYVNLKKAVEIDPKHTGAQGRLAELLSASHDPERLKEASEIASNVLKLAPDDVSARNALAISQFELGDKASAEAALKETLATGKADARSVVNLSLMRMYDKDPAGALNVLREGAAKNPKSSELALLLARMYAATKDTASAEKEFRRATEVDPKNPMCWATLASFYAASNRPADAEKAYRAASQTDDPKYKHFLGMYYWSTRNADAAIKEFERVADADPKDREARNRLVTAYRQSNREADADRVLQRAFSQNPKDFEARMGHAQSLARMGKMDEAANVLRLAVSDSRDSFEAHYLLSKIYSAKRQFRLQQQELDEALKVNPAFLAARLDLSQSQVALGRYDAALDVLEKAPKDQKTTLPWQIALNWALLSKGDVEKARSSIEGTLKRGPVKEALLQRAFLEIQTKQLPAARTDLNQLLAQDAQSVRALDALGSSYLPDMEAAVKAVGEHAAKTPASLPVQFAYSLWLSRAGKIDQAGSVLVALKSAAPGELSLDIRLGELALASRDIDGARKWLAPVVAQNAKIARAQMLLGHVESISGNADAAVAHYRAVAELEPENVEAFNNLASLLSTKDGASRETMDEAYRFAQKAKELAPSDPNISDTLGWVLYRQGLYAAALPQLEAATGSPNPVTRYHLAMAYAKAGDRERAVKEFAQAQKIAPQMPEARQAEELLRKR